MNQLYLLLYRLKAIIKPKINYFIAFYQFLNLTRSQINRSLERFPDIKHN